MIEEGKEEISARKGWGRGSRGGGGGGEHEKDGG